MFFLYFQYVLWLTFIFIFLGKLFLYIILRTTSNMFVWSLDFQSSTWTSLVVQGYNFEREVVETGKVEKYQWFKNCTYCCWILRYKVQPKTANAANISSVICTVRNLHLFRWKSYKVVVQSNIKINRTCYSKVIKWLCNVLLLLMNCSHCT